MRFIKISFWTMWEHVRRHLMNSTQRNSFNKASTPRKSSCASCGSIWCDIYWIPNDDSFNKMSLPRIMFVYFVRGCGRTVAQFQTGFVLSKSPLQGIFLVDHVGECEQTFNEFQKLIHLIQFPKKMSCWQCQSMWEDISWFQTGFLSIKYFL